MNGNPPRQSIADIGAEPHEWQDAVASMVMTQIREPLGEWLRDSKLPGVGGVGDGRSWSREDAVRFLKIICGEQD
jgi:hypothetical protein